VLYWNVDERIKNGINYEFVTDSWSAEIGTSVQATDGQTIPRVVRKNAGELAVVNGGSWK
jgi:hypothetical protein